MDSKTCTDDARRWTVTWIFLGCWTILLAAGRDRFFHDPGTLWHIVVGESILHSGKLIETDSFSFTQAGAPWIAQQWLGECLLALLHRFGGLDTVLLGTVTVLAWFLTWIAQRLMSAGFHPLVAVLLTALGVMASAYHFHPRPHLATIALLAWTFGQLCDFEAGRIGFQQLLWLVPIYIVWANIHGGMVCGVATLAVAGCGWSVSQWLQGAGPLHSISRSSAFFVLTLACGLAALVNPYGVRLVHTWVQLISSAVLPRLIDEHAPLLSSRTALPVFVLAAVYGTVLLGTAGHRPRFTWLLPLLWLFFACTRSRNGPLFAVTAVLAVGEMAAHSRVFPWLVTWGGSLYRVRIPSFAQPAAARSSAGIPVDHPAPLGVRSAPLGPGLPLHRARAWPALLLLAGLVSAAAILQGAGIYVPVIGACWARLDPSHWPVELLSELRNYQRSHADGTPVFNDMLFGGFLIYETPGLRVFIDDRCELYGDRGLLDYAQACVEDPGKIECWRKQYGFELALVVKDSAFDHYLGQAPGWSLIRAAEPAVLYQWAVP
jgi:hypothetical protein